MTIFLIVLVEYDWYEFTTVVAVCNSKEMAEQKAKEYGLPIFFENDPDVVLCEENEIRHIFIEEWAVK